MEARSTQKHIRISPRKVSIVLDLIRGKDYATACGILKTTPKAACEHVLKLMNKVAADAEHNYSMNADNLVVSECFVCPGMTLKRMMPRGKGSADRILKRTSHITIALKEKE